MKRLILMLLLLGANGWSLAQTQNMSGDLTKYWYYRWRLRNDFMVMGEGPGKSLVAEQRISENRNNIKWADATIMHGYYLSMLAIEHKILTDLNRYEDLKNNERELYFAIKAFERLDYWSETIFSADQPTSNDVGFRNGDWTLRGDVNGFCMRDDVPPDFLCQFPQKPIQTANVNSNFYKMNNGRTGLQYNGNLAISVPQHIIEGDFENHFRQAQVMGNLPNQFNEGAYLSPPYIPVSDTLPYLPIVNHRIGNEEAQHGLAEMSQDQVIRLILGFYTIVRSIPNQIFQIDLDSDGVNESSMNFVEHAKRHSTNLLGRAAGYFSGTTLVDADENMFIDNISYFSNLHHWITLDPRHLPAWFGEYTAYMPPLRALTPSLFTSGNDLGITNSNYNNYGSPAFNFIWATGLDGSISENNSHMVYLLALMSNTGLGLANQGNRLYTKTNNLDKDALYMPFYDYLWNWNPSGNNWQNKKMGMYNKALNWISTAPCVGPHNFGTNVLNSPNQVYPGFPPLWNQPFIYDAEEHEWNDGMRTNEDGDQQYLNGWFSGVDFMLLYNTVYANLETERPMYHDLINRIVDYPIYTSNSYNVVEYSASGLLIGAFENMKIRNVITGNASVEVKALDYVELQNGADINPETSGSIDIFPDKLTCFNNGSNGVYKINECSDCDLTPGLGLELAPQIKTKIWSVPPEFIPTIEESLKDETTTFVYPNPVTTNFKILGLTEEISIQIVDIYGNKIQFTGNNSDGFILNECASGVYYVIINDSNGNENVIKLVKL